MAKPNTPATSNTILAILGRRISLLNSFDSSENYSSGIEDCVGVMANTSRLICYGPSKPQLAHLYRRENFLHNSSLQISTW